MDHFDDAGHAQVDAATRRAAVLQLDAFAAVLPAEPDIKLGLGLVLHRSGKRRITAQVCDGCVGLGVAWAFVPVIHLAAGVGALYDVRDDRVLPTLYLSRSLW